MLPHLVPALIVLVLFPTGYAVSRTTAARGHADSPPASPADQASPGIDMEAMSAPRMAGTDMSGGGMSGGGMAGMTMSGMTPPAPTSPPQGPVLTLDAAEPAAATLRGAPGQIIVIFGRPTELAEVRLTNSVDQQLPLHATLPTGPVDTLTIPVTIPLRPGLYHLAWRTSGASSARGGNLGFTVLPADGSAAPDRTTAHHHH